MNSTGDKNNFFKNPIGVIGMFLVLTEAIASIVIVKSQLKDTHNLILVLFIVLFPCLVLFVFYRLVTQHHEKLYSPSDFKDEQNFVNTYNSVTQKEELQKVNIEKDVLSNRYKVTDDDVKLIKDVLVDIMELQKKVVPSIENSALSEDEKIDFVTNMDDYLLEMEEEDKHLRVEVSSLYKSGKFVEILRNNGYDASVYRWMLDDKKFVPNAEHEAIWMGSEVPVVMANEVVKTAKDFYPHLKYIQLSDATDGAPDYVKYQVFIGGATSTAKARELKPLSLADFNELYTIHEKGELHKFIRSFEA